MLRLLTMGSSSSNVQTAAAVLMIINSSTIVQLTAVAAMFKPCTFSNEQLSSPPSWIVPLLLLLVPYTRHSSLERAQKAFPCMTNWGEHNFAHKNAGWRVKELVGKVKTNHCSATARPLCLIHDTRALSALAKTLSFPLCQFLS